MMRGKTFWVLGMVVCLGVAAATVGEAAETGAPGANEPAAKQLKEGLRTVVSPIDASERVGYLKDVAIRQYGAGVARGAPPGTAVYRNVIDGPLTFFAPGANRLMADDITLAAAGCNLVYYDILVFGNGGGAFDVHVELLDGNPCTGGAVIAGTEQDFIAVDDDGDGWLLTAVFDPSVAIPEDLYISVRMSTDEAGWTIAAEAEIGSTADDFAYEPPGDPCGLFFFTSGIWAGMWTNIRCDLGGGVTGACCENFTCSETAEGDCPGTWLGPDSDCADPDPCRETTLAYRNDFNTGIYDRDISGSGEQWADDIKLAFDGCELAEYTLKVYSASGSVSQINVALYSNDDGGTPDVPEDDSPLALIAGTERSFSDVPSGVQALTAGPFSQITIPQKVWLWFEINPAETAGPLLAGMAGCGDLGSSIDGFMIFDGATWTGPWFFGGFDPTDCPWSPGSPCTPAGSFDIEVLCYGAAPTGACCDSMSAVCTDDVTFLDCAGECWALGAACMDDPFDSPCGAAACCKVDPKDPFGTICEEMLPADCTVDGGEPELGQSCSDLEFGCGLGACIGAEGGCFEDNGTAGCNERECCNIVCSFDAFCCLDTWDDVCANEAVDLGCAPPSPANDLCADAIPISEGSYDYSTLNSNEDGPDLPEQCSEGFGLVLGHDIWYDYTPSLSGTVTVSVCDAADYDARAAAYEGCECPVTNDRVVACDDDGCGPEGGPPIMEFPVTAGTCYKLRIGGWETASEGSGTVTVSLVPGGGDCPTGAVTFNDPPDGVVDARQPHPVGSTTPMQGIDTFDVAAPSGVSSCWSFCETGDGGLGANGIAGIADNGDGTYAISLDRPITPGEVTTLTYTPDDGRAVVAASFIAHPANVNGDTGASPLDILKEIDCVNGVDPGVNCPWGLYSCDANHSAECNSADILRVIDLLNGADTFVEWNGTDRPVNNGSCP